MIVSYIFLSKIGHPLQVLNLLYSVGTYIINVD